MNPNASRSLAVVFAMLGLVACPMPSPGSDTVATVTVTAGATSLEVGNSVAFSAEARNASNAVIGGKTFTWNSSDASVAEVSGAGIVTAKKPGTANISATTDGVSGQATANISFTLRIGATANGNSPLTVFVSAGDGSLLASSTANPGEGAKTFVFPNVPGDATVTGAYTLTKPVWNGSSYAMTTVYRLQTYPAAYANERSFSPINNNEFIAYFYATLNKPSAVAGVTQAGGVFPHFGFTASFGAAPSVTLGDALDQNNLQTDGRYSMIFNAYDANGNPLAYATFLDQTVDATTPNRFFTVGATDWKTDFSSLNLTITNYDGFKKTNGLPDPNPGYWCTNVVGSRRGVRMTPPNPCRVLFDTGARTMSVTAKYPSGFFDSFGYYTGWWFRDASQSGLPDKNSYRRLRGLASLPSNLTLDAVADFLAPPTNFAVADVGTERPSFSWTTPTGLNTTAKTVRTMLGVYNFYLGTGVDYGWTFDPFPSTLTSLKLPALPAALNGFAPTENVGGRKYRAYIRYFEDYENDLDYRFSDAGRNLDPAVVTVNVLQPLSMIPSQPETELERRDPFALELK